MGRVCTVCSHPKRADIDAALIRGDAYRGIAERYGASPSATLRHKDQHLAPALVQREERFADKLERMTHKALGVIDETLGEKEDRSLALRATLSLTRYLEIFAAALDRKKAEQEVASETEAAAIWEGFLGAHPDIRDAWDEWVVSHLSRARHAAEAQ